MGAGQLVSQNKHCCRTGSIAFGIDSEGKMARCGGFGPGIGDDGSAY